MGGKRTMKITSNLTKGFSRVFVLLGFAAFLRTLAYGGLDGALWDEVVLSGLANGAAVYLLCAISFLAIRWVLRGFKPPSDLGSQMMASPDRDVHARLSGPYQREG